MVDGEIEGPGRSRGGGRTRAPVPRRPAARGCPTRTRRAGGEEGASAAATTSPEIDTPVLIAATPAQAAIDQHITLTGNGFSAHEVVVVSLNGATARILARPQADTHGQFSVRVTVPAVWSEESR